MAILLDIASQAYSPQTQNLPFTVAANIARMRVTLTHPDWPLGDLYRIELLWAGISSGQWAGGGSINRDKAGNPIGGTTTTVWEAAKPPGVTAGQVRIQTLQTLTTAILVESI